MKTLQKINQLFYSQRQPLLFFVSLALIRGFIVLPIPWLLQQALTAWGRSDVGLTSVVWLGLLLTLSLIDVVLAGISRYGIVKAVKTVIVSLRTNAMKHFINQPSMSSLTIQPAPFKDQLVNSTERLDMALTIGLGQVFPALVSVVLLIVGLLYISPLLLGLSLILFPPMVVIFIKSRQKVLKLLDRYHQTYAVFERNTYFMTHSWELIKVQTAERTEIKRQQQAIEQLHTTSLALAKNQLFLQLTQESLSIVFGIGLLILGLALVALGWLNLSAAIAFFIGFTLLRVQLNVVYGQWPHVLLLESSLDNTLKILGSLDFSPSRKRKHQVIGELEVKNVSLSLAGQMVLNSVSLSIPRHQMTVVTGRNGEGKTTLLKILLGLMPADSGTVRVDGLPLSSLDGVFYRRQIGVVSQQPQFVDSTGNHNVAYGTAWAAAQLRDYQSELQALGRRPLSSLSGGEQQWIAILRALARQPKVLFLDEPTNHLDDSHKQRFYALLPQLLKQTTIFCITHDKKLISLAHSHYHLSYLSIEKISR